MKMPRFRCEGVHPFTPIGPHWPSTFPISSSLSISENRLAGTPPVTMKALLAMITSKKVLPQSTYNLTAVEFSKCAAIWHNNQSKETIPIWNFTGAVV